mmetsp:Transcript_14856/g.29991  ORF Transcript_14856/g.29991 Transcript_14856/m.29991 type:complete len:81 (+) Transcript_14856:488-730(+)
MVKLSLFVLIGSSFCDLPARHMQGRISFQPVGQSVMAADDRQREREKEKKEASSSIHPSIDHSMFFSAKSQLHTSKKEAV